MEALRRVAQRAPLLAVRAYAAAPKAAERFLITGGLGQLGGGLARTLRNVVGKENVIVTDVRKPTEEALADGPFAYADVVNYDALQALVVNHRIDTVIHLSALLSATAEQQIERALQINLTGFQNVIDLARTHHLRVFCPSTIGAFGPSTPSVNTPDLTIMRPTTIYGITKVHMELMGEYYSRRFGIDFRSLRYPGIISADSPPGGGTTDYAVHIFHHALASGKYTSFLSENTRLPMMYITDCLEGTANFIMAPRERLTQCTYNMGAIDFTPRELADAMKKCGLPVDVSYAPDFRQKIADSWPKSLDDSRARADWGWHHKYDLIKMTETMIAKLKNSK